MRIRLAAAALSAVLALSSCASGGAQLGRGPVVIGLVADLSAGGARGGNDVLKGAKLRAEELNRAGGIGGTPLRLEALDMKESPAEAVKALTRFAGEIHACAVIDASFARAGLALGSAADSLRIPLVSLGMDDRVTTPEVFESDQDFPGVLRRFSFLIEPTASQVAGAMARYALLRFPITRYATLSDPADPLSTIQARSFARAVKNAGKLLVASEEFSADPEGSAAALARIMEAQPQAVFICGSAEQNAQAARDAAGAGVVLLGNESWQALFPGQADAEVRNAWFATPETPDADALAGIAARFREVFGETPRRAVIPGWDAVGLVADAVLRARSMDPAKVASALEQTRGFAGMLGPVDMDPVTHRAARPPVAIVRLARGRTVMEDPRFPVLP